MRPWGPPATVLTLPPEGAWVLEVGVGREPAALHDWIEHRPDVRLVAGDLSAARLGSLPEGVEGVVLDALHPPLDPAHLGLAYAVRPPEELQAVLARWPCPVAIRPLGSELAGGPWRAVGQGWFLRGAAPLHHNL